MWLLVYCIKTKIEKGVELTLFSHNRSVKRPFERAFNARTDIIIARKDWLAPDSKMQSTCRIPYLCKKECPTSALVSAGVCCFVYCIHRRQCNRE